MKNIALARGQIEEAMGLIDGRWDQGTQNDIERDRPEHIKSPIYFAYKALMRARELLAEVDAARLAMAHYAPITAAEVERNS